jgi:hypothetical protein
MAKQNQKSRKQRGGDFTSWVASLLSKKPQDTTTAANVASATVDSANVASATVDSANVASATVDSANVASANVKPFDENKDYVKKVVSNDVKESETVVGGKKHKKSSKKSRSKRARKHKKSVKR